MLSLEDCSFKKISTLESLYYIALLATTSCASMFYVICIRV